MSTATAAPMMQESTSLPRIKQLYTTPSASPSSSMQASFPLPSWSRHKSREHSRAGTSVRDAQSIRNAQRRPDKHGRSPRSGALSPTEAVAKFRRVLTSFELDEIKKYPNVYFVGPTARKLESRTSTGPNHGYDDDKGRYKCVKNDHLAYRYEVLKGLGKGSFGDVVKAYDHKTKTHIALKIIRNERRFHKQGQSEIKILDLLRRQDSKGAHNVIHMKDSFLFRGHLCITFEMMHCDMYSALKKGGFRGFKLETIRKYAASLVTALRVLRRARIIHCDLKPENILMKSAGSHEIKVIDFGSSCFDHQRVHSYIQSRFYRSPEVILGLDYGVPIDMWSLGCIMAELLTGQPLFPGHDENEQLMYQMEVLGTPPLALLQRGKRMSSFFSSDGEPLHIKDRKGRIRTPRSRPLSKAVPCSDRAFLDFIARCLTWDPGERMTPREAAHHSWITGQAADLMESVPEKAVTASSPGGGLLKVAEDDGNKLLRTQSDGAVERGPRLAKQTRRNRASESYVQQYGQHPAVVTLSSSDRDMATRLEGVTPKQSRA